jgi:hypothetical protein
LNIWDFLWCGGCQAYFTTIFVWFINEQLAFAWLFSAIYHFTLWFRFVMCKTIFSMDLVQDFILILWFMSLHNRKIDNCICKVMYWTYMLDILFHPNVYSPFICIILNRPNHATCKKVTICNYTISNIYNGKILGFQWTFRFSKCFASNKLGEFALGKVS